MNARRTVSIVTEQPTHKGDKAHLCAYGEKAVATVAKCSTRTLQRAVEAGEVSLASMESVLMWVGNRKQKNLSKTSTPTTL